MSLKIIINYSWHWFSITLF